MSGGEDSRVRLVLWRLEPGAGERRDCARYLLCLSNYRGSGEARCPSDCGGFVPEAAFRATDFMRTDGAS